MIRRNIEIEIDSPYGAEHQSGYDDTPEMLGYPDVDEVLGAPAKLILRFYDAGTHKVGDNWEELDEFMTSYETSTVNVDVNRGVYTAGPDYYRYKVYSNSYGPTSSWIQQEYDYNINDDMWEREPLRLVDTFDDETTSPPNIQEPDSWSRWDGIGCNTPLLHVELLDEAMTVGTKNEWKTDMLERGANPDACLHGEPNGYDRPYHSVTIQNEGDAMTYTFDGIWKRNLDLSVQEYGSHSAMVTQMMAKNKPVGSDYIWTPLGAHEFIEGIFWQKFDTFMTEDRDTADSLTLERQYKITRVPKFDPDEDDDVHSGPIFRFTEGEIKECEVYLFPRQWMYYGRWMSCDYEAHKGRGLINWELTWDPANAAARYRKIPLVKRPAYEANFVYNNIFALWGRPPRDYWLPRRTDFDVGTIEGTMGKPIPASRMSGMTGNLGPGGGKFLDMTHADYPGPPLVYVRIFKGVGDDWEDWDGDTPTKVAIEYLPEGMLKLPEDQYWYGGAIPENVAYALHTDRNEDFFGWCNMSYEVVEIGETEQPAFASRTCVRGLDDCKVDGAPYQFAYGRGGMQCLYLFNFHSLPYSDYADFPGGYEGYSFSFLTRYSLSDAMGDVGYYDPDVHPWNFWGIPENLCESQAWSSWSVWVETPFGGVPIRTVYDRINEKRGGFAGEYGSGAWEWDSAGCFGEYGELFGFCMTAPDGGPIVFNDNPTVQNACEWYPDGEGDEYPRVMSFDLRDDPEDEGPIFENGENKIEMVIEESRTFYNGGKSYDEDEIENFHKLWNVLYNSDAVQDAISNSDLNLGAVSTTDVPYIVGVAPTKKESLVAILRVNRSEVYYIWKANEHEGEQRRWYGDWDGTEEEWEAIQDNYKVLFAELNKSYRGYLQDVDSPPRTVVGYSPKACPELWEKDRKSGFLYTIYERARGDGDGAADPFAYNVLALSRYTENWGRIVYKLCYPDVEWDDDVHDSFQGFEVEYLASVGPPPSYASVTLPWALEDAGPGIGNLISRENPTIVREEFFEFDMPWYVMTYRTHALEGTNSPWYASGYNVRRRCDQFYYEEKGDEGVSASMRNKDSGKI